MLNRHLDFSAPYICHSSQQGWAILHEFYIVTKKKSPDDEQKGERRYKWEENEGFCSGENTSICCLSFMCQATSCLSKNEVWISPMLANIQY